MKVFEKTRDEVEGKLKVMSDFLKMEYLEECIKQKAEIDIKRYCNYELARLYDGRSMFSEAARNMSSVAEMAATYKDKMQAYMGETGLWIKAAHYDRADESFKKALACGNIKEKEEMKTALIVMYKRQAEAYEKTGRNTNALRIYEKIMQISSNEQEKLDLKKKLLELYHRLGKIREYTHLKAQLDSASH